MEALGPDTQQAIEGGGEDVLPRVLLHVIETSGPVDAAGDPRLAFAPGGLEAMTIMAFALNLDPAYVAAHQIARYIGLVLLMPAVTGLVLHRHAAAAQPANVEED